MRIPVLLLVLSVPVSIITKAQTLTSSVINTSGNTYTKGYYSFDWSVGELALIQTMAGGNDSYFITNGFLQPNKPAERSVPKFSDDEIRILPNPTYNHFEINILTAQQGLLTISLFDANGKNVLSRRTTSYGIGSIEHFDISRFAAGTYFITIELKPVPGSVKKTGNYKIIKLS